MKRTTIELDEELLDRARKALGSPSIRATVEEALRRVADQGEADLDRRARAQRSYFDELPSRADLDVMAWGEAWR